MEVLARVHGELPGWCAWDAGMVSLSARETAKGEEQAAQLAALRQVLPVLQRSHPRAKRKPDPRIMHTRDIEGMLFRRSDLRRKEDFWVHVHLSGSSPLGDAVRKKSWKNNKKVLAGKIDL